MLPRFVYQFVKLSVALACLHACMCAQSIIPVPSGQGTIQAGINAAADGDTVLVAPGTYYENIDFRGKAITVSSSGGAAGTIIDGGAAYPVVTFQSKEGRSSVISGFTIRNGGAPANYFNGPSGIGIYSAGPTILNNNITANSCLGIDVQFGSARIQGNTIANNTTKSGFCDFGGGITLRGNADTGGNTHSEVVSNVIENNRVPQADGGAITIWAAEGSLIQGNTIRNNTGYIGGAIYTANTDSMSILGNLIYGNTSTSTDYDSSGALSIGPPGESAGPFIGIVAGNTITGNNSPTSTSADSPSPTDVMLSGNLGQYVLVNNIIASSSATQPAMACGTIYNYLSYTPLVFDHNDIFNAQGHAYGGACTIPRDSTGFYGNISADPKFVNPTAKDFHLQSGSPAIDAGNNSAPLLPTSDLDGSPRVLDVTGKGSGIVDMGAYEASGTVRAAPTVLSLTPSSFYPYFGFSTTQPFTLTAQATSALGSPTGPITVYIDEQPAGTLNLNASGSAVLTPQGILPGLHAFAASYPGQGVFAPAVSVKFYVLFPKATPTLSFTSSVNPSLVGNVVTFTVTALAPDGAPITPITLAENGTVFATLTPNSSGVATYATSSLALGTHALTAAYAGDAQHNSASTSLLQQVINGYATTTLLSSSVNPSDIKQQTTLSAHVASSNGTPTGVVTFTDGGTTLGTQTLDSGGNAMLPTAFTTAGVHSLKASFTAAAGFAGSSATLAQMVNGAVSASLLTVSPSNSTYSTQVTATATIVATSTANTATPTGTVIFYSDGSQLGTTAITGGVATLNTAMLAAGTHVITCSYSGDGAYNQSRCNLVSVVVTPAATQLTLASSLNPAIVSTPVVFTATLTNLSNPATSPTGVGGVTFSIDGQPVVTVVTDAAGHATYATAALAVGRHTASAAFTPANGAAQNYIASAAPALVQTINPFTSVTSLTATPNPASQFQAVHVTVTVASGSATYTPAGTVVITDGGAPIAMLSLTPGTAGIGVASGSLPLLSVGTHSLSAIFTPASNAETGSTSALLAVVVSPADYTLQVGAPSLTIQTEHHASMPVTLTSLGGLTGTFTLSCADPMPATASCHWPQATVVLPANGSIATTLDVDTDAVYHFKATLEPSTKRGSSAPVLALMPLAVLSALGLCRARHKMPMTFVTLLGLFVASSVLSGCGDKYPAHTPPGSYAIHVVATPVGDLPVPSRTATLTLVVTQ